MVTSFAFKGPFIVNFEIKIISFLDTANIDKKIRCLELEYRNEIILILISLLNRGFHRCFLLLQLVVFGQNSESFVSLFLTFRKDIDLEEYKLRTCIDYFR